MSVTLQKTGLQSVIFAVKTTPRHSIFARLKTIRSNVFSELSYSRGINVYKFRFYFYLNCEYLKRIGREILLTFVG